MNELREPEQAISKSGHSHTISRSTAEELVDVFLDEPVVQRERVRIGTDDEEHKTDYPDQPSDQGNALKKEHTDETDNDHRDIRVK